MEGTVKWFNRRKGYGFIKGDDDEDYFVHYSQVAAEVVLRDEDRVTFDGVDTDKGKQAQNVNLAEGNKAGAPKKAKSKVEEEPEDEEPLDDEAQEDEPVEEEADEEEPEED